MALLLSELIDELDIVGVETLDVIDAIFEHGDSINTDTKGKTLVLLIIKTVDS
jgi:hypothetical protein